MEAEIVVLLMFLGVLIGILLGGPIAFVLAGLAIIFGYWELGERVFPMFANRMWSTATNSLLMAIPMFIFMASILERSGIADKLFQSLLYAFGRLNGAIALTVVLLSTVFAAVTGVMGATVVSMSLMAIPAMLKYGYDKRLATGTVAAGGTIGIIIPPSIMLVIMADQSGESVGRLFAAGLLPGLLLASLYFLYILIRCWFQPAMGPALPREELDRYSGLQITGMILLNMVPPILLIFGVLGSIWFGFATPTEASAIGAFLSLVLMTLYGRFNWAAIREATWSTTRTSCMVLAVIVGATLFTQVFFAVGGNDVVTDLVLVLDDQFGRWGTFAMMMLVVFFLGFLIDWIGIILITFPIFLPLGVLLGFDELWLVMMIAVNLQASFLTPPVGYALFYLKGTVPKGVHMFDIYKGVIPFLLLQLVAIVIMAFYPEIITWLPQFVAR
ncbi:TRAP transporter large permease [Aquisalimonas asiatica]|uniref:TRAP transporter large permease protein n=1 Tax=Aquisalimonas asiatica TaxID=406100 RepID=A0A1H8VPX1_9GAMM|nr:TRAP transporter large permease subunit [Aquisalimonas asiatica]SEP17247.1 TRAP transporter, DctM subunit [Aquisalimonas asiatica]